MGWSKDLWSYKDTYIYIYVKSRSFVGEFGQVMFVKGIVERPKIDQFLNSNIFRKQFRIR